MKRLVMPLLLVGFGHAFVLHTQVPKSATTVTKAQKNDWFRPVAVAVAGWAMAAQLTFAVPLATMLPGESSCFLRLALFKLANAGLNLFESLHSIFR